MTANHCSSIDLVKQSIVEVAKWSFAADGKGAIGFGD
jgi:hypothetical protein